MAPRLLLFALLTVGARGSAAAASAGRRCCAAITASSGDRVSNANAGAPSAGIAAAASVSGLKGWLADALAAAFAGGGSGTDPFRGLAGIPACDAALHLS